MKKVAKKMYCHQQINSSINRLILQDNKVIISDQLISNALNDFFVNIVPQLASKITSSIIPTKQISSQKQSIFLKPVTLMEIHSTILQLNEKKACGPENIAIKYIKIVSELISPFLCDIFNVCFINGVFPTKLKKAKVKPSNYRPISMSPFS